MKIPCPQCAGEVQLQEAPGFPTCPFCGAGLVLDLGGVRPHLLYRHRQVPTNVLPLLRRWCDRQSLPAPSLVSSPHLTYYPFWRYVREGSPRLIPAWPTLEPRWADLKIPEAEQVFFNAKLIEGAEVVEPSLAEAAARERILAGEGTKPGDLVHVPFFVVRVRVGESIVSASVEACSGRVYVDSVPHAPTALGAGQAMSMALGFVVMCAEAAILPWAWLTAIVVGVTAMTLYWAVVGSSP